ncbi:MAG: hypothetical protein R2798_07090 [Chitinophagales bacterium]|nr:hypothetical protein [Bacteroidota bacterium]
MKNKIVKALTLTMFSTLIIAFVAYKSGYFGGPKSIYSVSPNGSALNNSVNTILKQDTSYKQVRMMRSPKFMTLRDIQFQFDDSNAVKIDTTIKIDPRLMYGSKSGIILDSEDLKRMRTDSTVTDSLKK